MANDPKVLTPEQELSRDLERMESEFKRMLPPQVPVDRFLRVCRTAVQMSPDLSKVPRNLLFGELMKAAQDGLLPNGQEAVINVFKGKPKYIPMVEGLCKMARNSGEIKAIDAQIVHERDEFEAWIDEKGQHFQHKRARGPRGAEVCGYAYCLTTTGGVYYEEMSVEEMDAVEKVSPGHNESWSPYRGPFRGEMRRKAPLRRLLKYRCPSSADLELAVRRDDDLYELGGSPPETRPQGGPERAAAALGATRPPPPASGSPEGPEAPQGPPERAETPL